MSDFLKQAEDTVGKKVEGEGMDQEADNFVNKEVDQVADDAGMGKYDSEINKYADKEVNSEISKETQ